MWKGNKWWNIQLTLGPGATLHSAYPASCKTPATFIDSIHQNNYAKTSNKLRYKIQLPRNAIVLSCSTYTEHRTKRGRWNPALRNVVTRSTSCNQEERPQRKTSCTVQPGLTYGFQDLRKVDLKRSTKKVDYRTEALVNL